MCTVAEPTAGSVFVRKDRPVKIAKVNRRHPCSSGVGKRGGAIAHEADYHTRDRGCDLDHRLRRTRHSALRGQAAVRSANLGLASDIAGICRAALICRKRIDKIDPRP